MDDDFDTANRRVPLRPGSTGEQERRRCRARRQDRERQDQPREPSGWSHRQATVHWDLKQMVATEKFRGISSIAST
jgi:hypothetical protein